MSAAKEATKILAWSLGTVAVIVGAAAGLVALAVATTMWVLVPIWLVLIWLAIYFSVS